MTAAPVGVLVALGGAAQEQPLVAALDRSGSGARVVRRCVDLADLLAAASARTASVALVDADLRRLDAEAIARLTACEVAVVAVVRSADEESERRMHRLGAVDVVSDGTPSAAVVSAVVAAPGRRIGDPLAALEADLQSEPEQRMGPPGMVIAVWGPTGAPGPDHGGRDTRSRSGTARRGDVARRC